MEIMEKAELIYECISDVMPDKEKKFKSYYMNKIIDALDDIDLKEKEFNEWSDWHTQEGHKIVKKNSKDWVLAEQCKKKHPCYAKDQILISEVWRDTDDLLCVRYISYTGRKLDWFHYVIKGSEITWW